MNPVENNQLCTHMRDLISSGSSALKYLPAIINKIIDLRAWEEREVAPGRIVKMKSLFELITAKPIDGMGEDPDRIEAVIKGDVEVLAKWREAMKHQGGDRKSEDARSNRNNVTDRSPVEVITGNSRAYTVSRLKEQWPELYEQVKTGGLSANAAAIQAGFRKRTVSVVTSDPYAVARSLLRHYSAAELIDAIKAVDAMS